MNAAKHAGPCRIRFAVEVGEEEILLAVLDGGVGLGQNGLARADGDGLHSLRRAVTAAGGTLDVSTPANALGGLSVRARFSRA